MEVLKKQKACVCPNKPSGTVTKAQYTIKMLSEEISECPVMQCLFFVLIIWYSEVRVPIAGP